MTLAIHSLESFSDRQLLQRYAFPQSRWCRFNFVSSADGAATLDGHSSGLGSESDQRLMQLLRWNADVLMVGSGTVIAEGYPGNLISDEGRRWREEQGMSPHPELAVLSTSGKFVHKAEDFFSKSPVTPYVFTTTQAQEEELELLSAKAKLDQTQTPQLSPHRVLDKLAADGLKKVHSEGGPSIFARFVAADVVDQLFLTLSPMLVGSGPRRIADAGDHPFTHGPRAMNLRHILEANDMLFLDYHRDK